MRNVQSVVQTQGLKQIDLRKVIQFQSLLKANVQDLTTVVSQILSHNCFFDGLKETQNNIESLSNEVDNDFDQDFAELYTKADDAAGYKMSGDGPLAYELPDDRKKYLSSEETIIEGLQQQLNTFNISDDQKEIGLFFIQSLDNRGFLPTHENPVEYLVRNTRYGEALIRSTLTYLQSRMDPAGVFAENIQQALLIQAERLPQPMVRTTLTRLINERYEDLVKENLDNLKEFLRVDNYELIDEAYRAFSKFHPVPFPGNDGTQALRTKREPDFVVKEVNGFYVAKSTDNNLPEIKVNQNYSNTLATMHREGMFKNPVYTFLRNQRQELNETISMLQERKHCLENVVSFVLNAQKEFLDRDDNEQILPLLMKDVAAKFGLNPSVVSRIASEKFIQMEEGKILNLREMFSLGIRTKSGERISDGELIDRIRKIIQLENHNKPKTWIELRKELKDQGYSISIKKLRKVCEEVKIPDSNERKAAYNNGRENNSSIDELMKKMNIKPVKTTQETSRFSEQLKIKL